MKVTRFLVALLLLGVLAGGANAYTIALSWNSCPTVVQNMDFTTATIYKMVLMATGITEGNQYSGHDTEIHVFVAEGGTFPDAWRFDDQGGCQTGSQIGYTPSGFSKTCPPFQGANPLGIQAYLWEQYLPNTASIRLANTFDNYTALVSTTVYTLFQVNFDHTYSVVGPSDPGLTCGGAEIPVDFLDKNTELLPSAGGNMEKAENTPHVLGEWPSNPPTLDFMPGNWVTWNGGVPAQTTTWGKVKNLYR